MNRHIVMLPALRLSRRAAFAKCYRANGGKGRQPATYRMLADAASILPVLGLDFAIANSSVIAAYAFGLGTFSVSLLQLFMRNARGQISKELAELDKDIQEDNQSFLVL